MVNTTPHGGQTLFFHHTLKFSLPTEAFFQNTPFCDETKDIKGYSKLHFGFRFKDRLTEQGFSAQKIRNCAASAVGK